MCSERGAQLLPGQGGDGSGKVSCAPPLLTLCHDHSVLCSGSTARGDGPAMDPTAPGPPGAATAP